jgi:hypothetical protein
VERCARADYAGVHTEQASSWTSTVCAFPSVYCSHEKLTLSVDSCLLQRTLLAGLLCARKPVVSFSGMEGAQTGAQLLEVWVEVASGCP